MHTPQPTDPLTGLHFRSFLEARLVEASQLVPQEGTVVLLRLDLDRFREQNRHLDYGQGDRVLQEVALLLQHICRGRNATIGRTGGDEFAIFLQDTTKEAAQNLAEHLRQTIGTIRLQIPLRVSIGGASSELVDPSNLWQAASAALDAAKRGGGDQIYWHEPGPQ